MTQTRVLDHQDLQQNSETTTSSQKPDVLHLLHVEDNAGDALLMQEYIRGIVPSVEFDTAVRLAEVVTSRAEAADCALLDLSLPDAAGLEGLVALRGMSERLPIIVLTGFDNMELALTAVRDGADDYLVKNHVDGYTLERAVQYAIERRRLMLQLAAAAAAEAVAQANALLAEAAPDSALQQTKDERASVGKAGKQPLAALGTHEVSVRIDDESGEYALSCTTCDWQAERGSDQEHSWTGRSLDLVLLQHLDFSGRAREAAAKAKEAESPAIERRRMLRPRRWLGQPETTDHQEPS